MEIRESEKTYGTEVEDPTIEEASFHFILTKATMEGRVMYYFYFDGLKCGQYPVNGGEVTIECGGQSEVTHN